MTKDLSGLLGDLIAVADEAGVEIMRQYGSAEIRAKPDASPVTDADEAAEAIILERLAALTPDIAVVAEESVAAGHEPGNLGAAFWLVDPLDGTKEFISGNGEFTVNIALVKDGLPVMGVVGAPAKDLLYATDGNAVTRRSGGTTEGVSARKPPSEGLYAAVSRSHLDEKSKAYLTQFAIAGTKSAGSSLKFCLVAEGTADVYPRFGRTMEWDTAAGHAVVRAAGGSVCDADGSELAYGKPGFENPSFIVRGRTD
ncbi:MAG: 3'(2'),5'-bisphosphate nucleotidase CysQ [Pseudomonadota bacterium]